MDRMNIPTLNVVCHINSSVNAALSHIEPWKLFVEPSGWLVLFQGWDIEQCHCSSETHDRVGMYIP